MRKNEMIKKAILAKELKAQIKALETEYKAIVSEILENIENDTDNDRYIKTDEVIIEYVASTYYEILDKEKVKAFLSKPKYMECCKETCRKATVRIK